MAIQDYLLGRAIDRADASAAKASRYRGAEKGSSPFALTVAPCKDHAQEYCPKCDPFGLVTRKEQLPSLDAPKVLEAKAVGTVVGPEALDAWFEGGCMPHPGWSREEWLAENSDASHILRPKHELHPTLYCGKCRRVKCACPKVVVAPRCKGCGLADCACPKVHSAVEVLPRYAKGVFCSLDTREVMLPDCA